MIDNEPYIDSIRDKAKTMWEKGKDIRHYNYINIEVLEIYKLEENNLLYGTMIFIATQNMKTMVKTNDTTDKA